jgi:hypothetical protein
MLVNPFVHGFGVGIACVELPLETGKRVGCRDRLSRMGRHQIRVASMEHALAVWTQEE